MKLIIATTTPETLVSILQGQPRFLAKHFKVEIITSPSVLVADVEMAEGLRVCTVPMTRGISVLWDLYSIFAMVRMLRRAKPFALHSYTPKAGLICMLAGYLCRVPVRIHTFTGLIFPTAVGVRKRVLIFVDRLICCCATVVVPESQGVRKDLVDFRITEKNLRVIGSGNIAGVDVEKFSRLHKSVKAESLMLLKRLKINEDEHVFVFVGRFNADKGLRELVDAFSRLSEKSHLLLVGRLDEVAPIDCKTKELIRLHPRIHDLGYMSDVRVALQASFALILPSYREGFPNVILQAGAMGVPVIASDISGCNELIRDGVNGWLVKPRDPESLYLAMRNALNLNPLSYVEMGQMAREIIVEKFERQAYLRDLIGFYRGIGLK